MQNITLSATFQDGKITIDINDIFKSIQQDKITEVKYKKVEPKPMAFDTKEELDDYVKNNPYATCFTISTEELLRFIKENQRKYFFLGSADLRDARLGGVNLRGAYLRFARLYNASLYNAILCDANLDGASYNSYTSFPEGFIIPKTMKKI